MLTEEFKRKALEKLEDPEELKDTLKKVQLYRWIARAEHVLQRMEFSGTEMSYGEYQGNLQMKFNACPICGQENSHTDDCELHKLLKEAEEINI